MCTSNVINKSTSIEAKWKDKPPLINPSISTPIIYCVLRGKLEPVPADFGQETEYTLDKLPMYLKGNTEANSHWKDAHCLWITMALWRKGKILTKVLIQKSTAIWIVLDDMLPLLEQVIASTKALLRTAGVRARGVD